MRARRSNLVLAPLAGAAMLAALAIWGLRGLPWKSGFLSPRTLIDWSTPVLAPGCALLTDAARVIPSGASFVVLTVPSDARLENWYFRFGVGLLPGRRAILGGDADYVLVVGHKPTEPPGELVLRTPEGTVWRRPKT